MSSAKKLVKNVGIYFFAEVLSILLSFLLIILIARYLGDAGLGKYSFVFAFVGIFSILSDFGVSTLMTKEIPKDKSMIKKFLHNALTLKIVLGAVVIVLSAVSIYFTKQPFDVKIGVLFAALAMFMYYISNIFRVVINVYEIQLYQFLYRVGERLIAFSLGAFVLYKGYGLIALVSVFIISNFFGLLILYISIQKKVEKVRLGFDIEFIKGLFKKSLPFWFTSIFMTIYFKIDTIMLSFMKGYEATGWYNASYKIIDSLSFIPFVIIPIVFPVMSKFYKDSRNLLQILYEKLIYYLFIIAVPIGIGATMLASRIILFVYKKEFINSVIVLQILVWALVLMFVNYIIGYLLNSIDKQKLFTFTAGFGALLNVALNLILIPMYSYIGAAVATVATELLNFVFLFYFASASGFKFNLYKITLRPLIAGAAMAVAIYYLFFMHLLFIVPIAAALYFIVLLLIGGIHKEEIGLMKAYLPGGAKQSK